MLKNIRLGIIRETKIPPDKRVPVTPAQVADIHKMFPHVTVCVEPSPFRCFSDDEYTYLDVDLASDMKTCDVFLGVKEVKISALIPDKTYIFFAHVAKKQPKNRELLRAILEKNITLIDYEYLTKPDGSRIVAFGRWAGVVGAYNALRASENRTNYFKLKPAHECHEMDELFAGLKKITLKPIKILVTGGGRVANGAMEVLNIMGLRKVTPKEFLNETFLEPVFCQIEPMHYVKRKDGQLFDMLHFIQNPADYESTFKPYTKVTDIFIACHFWDNKSPHFIEKVDFLEPGFRITVIADISCDVNGPIYSTLRATTIENPFFGYNPQLGIEEVAFTRPTNVTIMSVDNLPGELPRDASRDFGRDLFERVFPALFGEDENGIIDRATIAKDGKLTPKFAYLQNYVDGKE